MKKLLTMMLALALVLTAFAGISVEPAKAAGGDLSFYDIMSTTDRMEYFEKVFAAFEKETGIHFVYEGEPWANSMGTVLTMMAANNGPDFFVCMPNQKVFVENGWLAPIDEFIAAHDDEYVTLIEDYFWAQQVQTFGNAYWFPDGIMGSGIYYRKDWAAELGWEAPEGKDWNWEAFWDLAVKMTDPEKNRYGFAFRGGSGAGDWANNYLGRYVANYTYDPETKLWMAEEYNTAMKLYTDSWLNGIAPKDSLSWGWSEQIDGFASGLVGLFFNDSDAFPFFVERMQPEQWGVLPIPYDNAGTGFATSVNCTYSWSINAHADDVDACFKLADFLYTPEYSAEYCMLMGSIPVRKDVAATEYFSVDGPLGGFVQQLNNPDAVLAGQMIGENKTELAGYTYDMGAEMQMYLMGEITFEQFCEDWNAWNQAAIDAYFAKGGEVTDTVKLRDIMAELGIEKAAE